MAEAAIVQILPQLQIGNQSLGQALGQHQEQAEARALQQGVPSTSLVMRVLRDVAHELAGRRKAQREKDFASAGKGAFSGFGALRAALESPPEGTVDRLIIEEAKLDQAPDEIPRPQPGHHDSARYPSVEESHEGPLYASSEAHARQQSFLAWPKMPARLRAHRRLLRKPMLVSRAFLACASRMPARLVATTTTRLTRTSN